MVTQNSTNNGAGGDFSVNQDTSGTVVVFSANHSENTNTSSHAEVKAETGGASGGDPFLRLSVSSAQDYSFGVDNSNSDDLVITDDADPSTGNQLWNMSSSGNITCPLQPAFLAYLGTVTSNVTGDGTGWILGNGVAFTEVFDQNSDFFTGGASGCVFTAPISGRYHFICNVNMSGLTSSHILGNAYIVTSNATFRAEIMDPYTQRNATTGGYSTNFESFSDMDAADIMHCQIDVGGGTKVVDVNAPIGGLLVTLMSGYLVV